MGFVHKALISGKLEKELKTWCFQLHSFVWNNILEMSVPQRIKEELEEHVALSL